MKYLLTMLLLITAATSAFGQTVGTVRTFDGQTASRPIQVRSYNPVTTVKRRTPKPKKKAPAPRVVEKVPAQKLSKVKTYYVRKRPTTGREHVADHIQSNPFYIPAEKN